MTLSARRHLPRPTGRLGSLLCALLLLSTGAAQDGYGLRPCPHHEAGAREVASAGAHVHATHHGGAAEAPADEDAGRHGCSCIGACGAGGAVPVAPAAAPAGLASVPARRAAPARPDERLPGRPPFSLPPSHAPPPLG